MPNAELEQSAVPVIGGDETTARAAPVAGSDHSLELVAKERKLDVTPAAITCADEKFADITRKLSRLSVDKALAGRWTVVDKTHVEKAAAELMVPRPQRALGEVGSWLIGAGLSYLFTHMVPPLDRVALELPKVTLLSIVLLIGGILWGRSHR